MPHTQACPTCKGKTYLEEMCEECGGKGMNIWSTCKECRGTGKKRRPCPGCGGKGYMY